MLTGDFWPKSDRLLENFPTKWIPARLRKCGKIKELEKLRDCDAIVKRSGARAATVEYVMSWSVHQMAATDRRLFLSELAGDSVKFALIGCSVGLGFMITHEPGSQEYLLRWDASKLVYALVGSAIGAVIMGFLRWRRWTRSHPEARD